MRRVRKSTHAVTTDRPTQACAGAGARAAARAGPTGVPRPRDEREILMSLFTCSDEVRDTLCEFLSQVTADDELRPRFVEANGIVLSDYTDPDCSILMDFT